MSESFFVPAPGGWRATELTRGPWGLQHQHGGPPSALIAHAIEAAAPNLAVARLTVDFLRPVPIDVVTVQVSVLRGGAKVKRLVATLHHGDAVVAHAVATLIRRAEVAVAHPPPAVPMPSVADSPPFQFPFFPADVGYHTAMETRVARGQWGTGTMTAWMRQRVPLLPGTPVSPLQRVLVAADSGSGVSAAIEPHLRSAINADLTLAVHRPLEGEWVGLDSVSTYEASGAGLTDTRVFDERGTLGRALQALVLEARAG